MLEEIIEQAQNYKAKALLSRAGFEMHHGRVDSAFYFYTEGLKTNPSICDYVELSRCIAVAKSTEGFHESALKDMERLIAITRYAEPLVYYDFLNSYAVELGVAGRKDEARNISKLVLASPFAFAYPEWQQTAEDLKGINRSFVVIDPSPYVPQNVLQMPAFERDSQELPSWAGQPAQVVNYEQWIKKMAKGKKRNGGKNTDEMTVSELTYRIMEIFVSPDMTYEKRRKLVEAAERIMSEPDKPEPDEPKPDDPEGA